ncbi:hypothetical protein L7F22_059562 [Adiantum nelumboides]|nr:hypothetical protein [Adiantum nelumboides]
MEGEALDKSSQQQVPDKEKIKLSCVKFIDALWFCYSPFYQVKEYYREGTFDNCRSKWGELFDCFHLKTLSEAKSQEILQSREREKMNSHIWQFYTKEEASAAWKQMFGHLDEE